MTDTYAGILQWARRGNVLLKGANKPSMHGGVNTVCLGLLAALVIEVVFFSIRSPYFFDDTNLANIGRAMTIIGIVAIGQTVVIIAGGFDLSVGSVMGAAGMVAAYMVNEGAGTWVGLLAAIMLGVLVGAVNGFVVSSLRINPLITTLATLSVIRGLAYVISGGEAIVVSDETLLGIGTDSLIGIPIVVILLLALFAAFGFLMPRTRFGRYIYAIGSGSRAARLAGIRVNRWLLLFYVLSAALAAIAGFITLARTGQAQPASNMGAELDVITAVILGGASLAGGRGRLLGTFLALTVLAVLANGMVLIGVESYWQLVVKGAVLLAAVVWGELRLSTRDRL
ncbi:ABC transporter permease [Micromonosporaceae bacterium B7E4]